MKRMKPIIRVENLGKQYRIGRREAAYATLRESLVGAACAPFDRLRRGFRRELNGDAASDRFWALKDVSFEVKLGEVLGIIGCNGAGKSTLLKVLSRITEPTTGRVDLYGRVGSLLEVGTGFHPELTGRENVYLNGAILGMSRREIARRFDGIVDFAGVERFLETPVKRYSSGMQMRLAFAVAAHLEPEVLVIDEVLAVGDAQFQKKCLHRIRGLSQGDRTILFVSHNMAALRLICTRALTLDRGRVVDEGDVNGVVDRFIASAVNGGRGDDGRLAETEGFVVDEVRVASKDAGPIIKTFAHVEIRVQFRPKVDVGDPGLYVSIETVDGARVAGLDFKDFTTIPPLRAGERAVMGFDVVAFPLLPASYHLGVWLKDMATHRIEQVPTTFGFEVTETPVYGGRKLDHWYGHVGFQASAFALEASCPS